ncbi:phosphoglycerate mutase-like protein [Lojkania enalia]|uniref:Phosphoglycerate mutase-like protein n=1 Tax=Lojkania enalia TaxID=147567 RepID=A0A9P4K741_9PLEO|nr:phosphoglycerate mutase-like protein [Didymosphaeria enalia]
MLFTLLSVVCSGLLLPAQAERILGITVFTRHGDRTSKHYSGYGLTNLGLQQNYQVGSNYRSIYISSNSSKQILGISEDKVINSQIYASAPDQPVLLNTATAFLQGLYPPLENLEPGLASETLNNGSSYTSPLNGYQYVVLHGEEDDSPDAVWLKGDEDCPAVTTSAKNFKQSAEFVEREKATRTFYQSLYDYIGGVYDYDFSDMSYNNAYDIFDLLNVASIHNASSAGNVYLPSERLFQLRTLADSAEFALNYNSSDSARSIGGQTFAGAVLNQMSQMLATNGNLKFSLLAGSYDTFLAFFGLANLTSASSDFYGLPDYASTMAFELFTEETVDVFPTAFNDIRVRFLFRNGSDEGAPLRTFPLFGRSEDSLSWVDFTSEMNNIAITSAQDWCSVCQSNLLFCLAYSAQMASSQNHGNSSSMSNTVAGVIGAMVTLGVIASLGLAAFFVLRRRRGAVTHINHVANDKSSQYSGNETA